MVAFFNFCSHLTPSACCANTSAVCIFAMSIPGFCCNSSMNLAAKKARLAETSKTLSVLFDSLSSRSEATNFCTSSEVMSPFMRWSTLLTNTYKFSLPNNSITGLICFLTSSAALLFNCVKSSTINTIELLFNCSATTVASLRFSPASLGPGVSTITRLPSFSVCPAVCDRQNGVSILGTSII